MLSIRLIDGTWTRLELKRRRGLQSGVEGQIWETYGEDGGGRQRREATERDREWKEKKRRRLGCGIAPQGTQQRCGEEAGAVGGERVPVECPTETEEGTWRKRHGAGAPDTRH